MKKVSLKSTILLVLTALVWGMAFVAQSVGMNYIGPFTFNCIRSIMGGIVLIPCIMFWDKKEKTDEGKRKPEDIHTLLTGGICCGVALCVASNLQQIGIKYTTVGKAGFITALYIVLVPVFGIFLRKKVSSRIWISVAIAVAGLYLLCITDELKIGKGDFFVVLCALVFAIHILVIDYFSPKVNGMKLSCIQFFVAGALSGIPMIISEKPEIPTILAAWAPLLYAGIMSCGVGYTLQIIAQKDADPTVASLILSLESVFSVLAGWVILGQTLAGKEIVGCVLMFAAIILAQLPSKTPKSYRQ